MTNIFRKLELDGDRIPVVVASLLGVIGLGCFLVTCSNVVRKLCCYALATRFISREKNEM